MWLHINCFMGYICQSESVIQVMSWPCDMTSPIIPSLSILNIWRHGELTALPGHVAKKQLNMHFCWRSLGHKCLRSGTKLLFAVRVLDKKFFVVGKFPLYVSIKLLTVYGWRFKKPHRLWYDLFWYKMLIFYSRCILMKKYLSIIF